jgi:hypothetical protein
MRFMRCLLFRLSVGAVAGLASSSSYAQTASLTGTVTDPVGAVLPGATVTISEVQTSASRRSATDERGNYRVLPGFAS